jgi:hypothetical protein
VASFLLTFTQACSYLEVDVASYHSNPSILEASFLDYSSFLVEAFHLKAYYVVHQDVVFDLEV